MKLAHVHAFFKQVGDQIPFPMKVFITGGAAAIAFGVSRVTEDIDFEVELGIVPAKHDDAWKILETVLSNVQKKTGITPQFSEDIDHWSSITLPFKRSKRLWKLGHVEVRVFDPLVWSVGKLARYLITDESDVIMVFKKRKISAQLVIRAWALALAKSPASSAQTMYRDHVRAFFKNNATAIWGPKTDPDRMFTTFLETATKAKSKQ